jgi:hypothetical protein
MKFLKNTFSILLITISAASAQKLPNIQETSIRAKKEVNNENFEKKFQAYNKSTDIFYTLSNDDNKLYLTVGATDPFIIQKIASGGLTFTISSGSKITEKVSITFPTYGNSMSFYQVLNNQRKKSEIEKNQNDSLKNVLNVQIGNRLKFIEITGIKAISDSLISVYNEYGIKANAFFDNNIKYNYKLELPLKYLSSDLTKVSYNIKLNGTIPKNAIVQSVGNGQNLLVTVADRAPYTTPVTNSPTDFSGEYILAK